MALQLQLLLPEAAFTEVTSSLSENGTLFTHKLVDEVSELQNGWLAYDFVVPDFEALSKLVMAVVKADDLDVEDALALVAGVKIVWK